RKRPGTAPPGRGTHLAAELALIHTDAVARTDCIPALKALGEETRLRILRLLSQKPLGVNEISERLRVSQYNVSKHLRILREAGLLEARQQGKQRVHSVASRLTCGESSRGKI